MNRLTAIGLASLAAYGLLIATKYLGVVSASSTDTVPVAVAPRVAETPVAVTASEPVPAARAVAMLPAPLPRANPSRLSPAALEFRAARDLRQYADMLAARRVSLSGDERFHLARALEECQFATSINEDLATYSAKQRRQFIAGLPTGDPLNARRLAAYDAQDNTARCIGFQKSKISPREIDELYAAAAQQGDPRAQARLIVAELNASLKAGPNGNGNLANSDFARIIGLLETRDPEAMMIVGQFLAQSAMASQLRVGPNGEVPEPSAFLGAFSLVACDMVTECVQLNREPQMACAYGGYCDAATFEELYQNFLASPWAYTQAMRYRGLIHTAIDTRNWGLLGLVPPSAPATGP
jgi:hypothetical protein